MVKLRKLNYKSPSYTKQSDCLSKNPSNRWLIMSFKYLFKRVSIWASNRKVMDFFALLIFAKYFVPGLYNPNRWIYSRNLLLYQNLWTLQYMNALTNDTPAITTRTSDWIQELLEGFLHNNKSTVVAMSSTSSSNELQIYFETLRYGEIEKT